MSEERPSIKIRLALGCSAIAVMLVISGLTALSIQRDAAETAAALVERNESDLTILALKADIARSMFPAHNYLIEEDLGNKK